MDIPVKVDSVYEMVIEDMGSDGEGIGHVTGFTVFVPGAIIGDRISARIDKVSKRYAVGHLVSIIEPSDYRIQPPCPVANRCGGCHIQTMAYDAQLAYKTRRVKDALQRIGGLDDVPVLDTIGMESPWRYRNKAQLPVGVSSGRPVMGFFAADTHDIVDINACPIQHPAVDGVIKTVKDYISRYNVPIYDEMTGKGLLRHIMVRVGFNSGQVMVVPVINGDSIPYAEQFVDMLQQNVNGLTSVALNINRQRTNVILGSQCKVIYGSDHITDTLCGLVFKISPLSFFQVNPRQTEVLYTKAVEYAALDGTQTVLDAYCGIGTISLLAAKRTRKVYGIEEVPQAIEDARDNAHVNGIDNAEFICGKAEEVIAGFIEEGVHIDVIIMDPPRKGCDEAFLEAAVRLAPDCMVYVSCNPATLARDMRFLCEHGYKATAVQPVDMFPHTVHVECVILMQRSGLEDEK
ncbi:23S rRNA (uracil(1939)-C(5))-methyltransferase RlmD [Mahella sp.]|uniref:23S rRNA (uracil(1939)-C(5))-methyltransferase RlmD n=1 Tax=Mahella sp. TaxID=2798721 RepID=UPI0025C0E12F|nr:23S rRNA (uracil(1939)-C(5))-methyltransferase RlmD [Mahella sp.]MBZ4665239.1 rRNA m(5)U939 methyltransferase [Mahella sp.]